LNDENTLQDFEEGNLSNIEINNGFTWAETSEGDEYWSKKYEESWRLNIIHDMDEVLYKEYERRNMKESSEQNPITKDIVENGEAETTKQEFQTITLNGIEYNLIPTNISVGYIANFYDKDMKAETTEEYLKRKFKEGNGQYEVLFKEKKSKDWSFCYRPNDLTWRKDCDYILIKKEHKEIIEAYLKDTSIKIQFRWYDEDWMLLDDFIENYDEDMQLRVSKKEFEPFTLNIEVNTIDEAKSLWNRFNLNYNTLCRALCNLYNVEFENRISTHKYWTQIDDILKDFGEVPDVNP
jgi:hypothetical protein